MEKPNIFNYATSELSQDAIICYILEWAKSEYKDINYNLHKMAIYFLDSLFNKFDNVERLSRYEKIEIKKQYKSIDVLCIINDKYSIIIEDKVNTKNHSNQLERYFKLIEKDYSDTRILPIYFKTIEQDNYDSIKNNNYKLYLRNDFLNVLKSFETKNDIINDYKKYLQNIDDSINSYETLPIDKWSHYSWIGFFIRLKKELGALGWGYVANPSGGFYGYWWHWKYLKIEGKEFEIYLQLEYDKLVFKLTCNKEEDRKDIRELYRNTLLRLYKEKNIFDNNEIKPFGRVGKWMGVAKLEKSYIVKNDEKVNIEATIQKLKEIEELLDEVAKELENIEYY